MRADLLLLHGTIYGYLGETDGNYVFPDLPSGFVNAEVVPWRDNIPFVTGPNTDMYGPITADNIPIDVVSWPAGTGVVGPNGLDIWQQCLTLFMRHI